MVVVLCVVAALLVLAVTLLYLCHLQVLNYCEELDARMTELVTVEIEKEVEQEIQSMRQKLESHYRRAMQ